MTSVASSTASSPDFAEQLSGLRRRLHRIPEVGLDLPQTQALLERELSGLPVRITRGEGLSWLAVEIVGGQPGPRVLLRADMDALPVVEQAPVPYASQNGAMHACGHDLHMAGLVGAIRLLCERQDELAGGVLAVFQPGEEGHDGAERMVSAGVLDLGGDRPIASYGLHVFSFLPAGTFACRPGTIMAGTVNFHIDVHGVGGHAARPSGARNPILVASQIVQSIQAYVTQKSSPDDPVIATVGSVTGGSAPNVIPDRARLGVSVRALSPERLQEVFDEITALAASIAEGFGQSTSVISGAVLPPTVSSTGEDAFIHDTVTELFGADRYQGLAHAEMVSEDFSHFLDATGGAFFFLGAGVPSVDGGPVAMNHSPLVQFDDSVVADGAALLAELAIRRLDRERRGARA